MMRRQASTVVKVHVDTLQEEEKALKEASAALMNAENSIFRAKAVYRSLNSTVGLSGNSTKRAAAKAWLGPLSAVDDIIDLQPLGVLTPVANKRPVTTGSISSVLETLVDPEFGTSGKIQFFSRTAEGANTVKEIQRKRVQRRTRSKYWVDRGYETPLGVPFRPLEGPTSFLERHHKVTREIAQEAYRSKTNLVGEITELNAGKTVSASLPEYNHKDFFFSMSKHLNENPALQKQHVMVVIDLIPFLGSPTIIGDVGRHPSIDSYRWGSMSCRCIRIIPMEGKEVRNFNFRVITLEAPASFSMVAHVERIRQEKDGAREYIEAQTAVFTQISQTVQAAEKRKNLFKKMKNVKVSEQLDTSPKVMKALTNPFGVGLVDASSSMASSGLRKENSFLFSQKSPLHSEKKDICRGRKYSLNQIGNRNSKSKRRPILFDKQVQEWEARERQRVAEEREQLDVNQRAIFSTYSKLYEEIRESKEDHLKRLFEIQRRSGHRKFKYPEKRSPSPPNTWVPNRLRALEIEKDSPSPLAAVTDEDLARKSVLEREKRPSASAQSHIRMNLEMIKRPATSYTTPRVTSPTSIVSIDSPKSSRRPPDLLNTSESFRKSIALAARKNMLLPSTSEYDLSDSQRGKGGGEDSAREGKNGRDEESVQNEAASGDEEEKLDLQLTQRSEDEKIVAVLEEQI